MKNTFFFKFLVLAFLILMGIANKHFINRNEKGALLINTSNSNRANVLMVVNGIASHK